MPRLGPTEGATALTGAEGATALTGTEGATAFSDAAASRLTSPLLSGALITNRDGIAGYWRPPAEGPLPLFTEHDDLANGRLPKLQLWGPSERAGLYDFELISRLHFNTVKEGAVMYHVETSADAPPASSKYHNLFTAIRPDETKFTEGLRFLGDYAELRSERTAEILAQLGLPIPFFSSIVFLDQNTTRWTLELLSAALRFTYFVCMRFKQALACRRPHEYSPQVQPIIPVPLHGSLPSGHAAEAFVTASVLWQMLQESGRPEYKHPGLVDQLMAQAERIAVNRTVAGVHFPVDSLAGATLGLTLGDYLVSRCSGGAGYQSWRFDGRNYPADRDFSLNDVFDVNDQTRVQRSPFSVTDEQLSPASSGPILKWLWGRAVKEWM